MKAKTAVITVTVYLIGYMLLIVKGLYLDVIPYFSIINPLLIVALVYIVLKDNKESYPELGQNEEWGYLDKAKNQLGFF